MKKKYIKELLFGLDIGTRTVIGSVGYMEHKKWVVVESVCMEHEERAMIDGQIHDIQKVAAIVERVKKELEARLGMKLTKVAIAAAGRVLNTQLAQVEQTFESTKEISRLDIQGLELIGIDKAKQMLEDEKKINAAQYFCVAHTVAHYYLDGYIIANLDGHKGQKIGAQIIATFLPKDVIESLYAVTERVGLEVCHLTLEPIAAINAVIPDNLRLLNLALVDVGAGTSDIAITREGSVVAYGMIPIAGDEVTETIVHKYLVDFNTAEKIKQALQTQDLIEFEDIIGITYSIAKEEILNCIDEPMNNLASQVAKNIIKINGRKSPNAVFCVGGGSQMPGFTHKLAEALEIPHQRVAIRTLAHIQNIEYETDLSKGPEMITPIGICMTASQSTQKEFTIVYVNGKQVELLNTAKLTVLDALLEHGIVHTQIFPANGKTLMFKLNEERVRIKGKIGEISKLQVNGEDTSLEIEIEEGDHITFYPAQDGEPGRAIVKAYIDNEAIKHITFENNKLVLPIVLVNGDCGRFDYRIKDNDLVQIIQVETLGQLFEALQIDTDGKRIMVGQEVVDDSYAISDQDVITIQELLCEQEATPQDYEPIAAKVEEPANLLEGDSISVCVNDQQVILPYKDTPYMFANIFDFIDFDLTKPQGTIQLLLNGERAAVTDQIHPGDAIAIFWAN